MSKQEMMEEIDRIARLCEAKDEEIEAQHEKWMDANTLIAMQAEALNAMLHAFIEMKDGRPYEIKEIKIGQKDFDKAYDASQLGFKALSATSETVAAWRAKETEPLRREVAKLRNKISDIAENCPHTEYDSDCTSTGNADDAYNHGADMARSVVGGQLRELLDGDTQATALAYEREVAEKALTELFSVFSPRGTDGVFCIEAKELEDYIAELRANKGEVK